MITMQMDTKAFDDTFTFTAEDFNQECVEKKPPKQNRKRKGQYFKKLQEENQILKECIRNIMQKINVIETQNTTLAQQLDFFKKCFPKCSVPKW